jgi:DNA-binding NtrC family response regulator
MTKKTIVFADDDEFVREFVSKCIRKYLPEVSLEICKDGISLEKRLQQGAKGINLILTDNQMPCIDGSEIIKKYARSLEKIPFILYYGGENEIGEQAVKDGAFAYALKGSGSSKMIELIKKALTIE